MSIRKCAHGHTYEKTSSCPVCPICSKDEITKKYGDEFPKIGTPAFRAINSIGIRHLSDLTKYSEKELLELHGFGPKALGLLRTKLKTMGKSFAKKD